MIIRPLACCLAMLPANVHAQGAVQLRNGERNEIQISSVDASGLHGTIADAAVVIPWSMIALVEGEDGAEPHIAAGESLWRGITRLDRGDPIAAMERLESAFEHFHAESGVTPAISADALLAARLRLDQAEAAVFPWMLKLERESVLLEPLPGPRAWTNESMRIAPELPPIFVGSRQAPQSAAELAASDFGLWSDGVHRRYAELYASALLLSVGESPPPIPDDIDAEGVRLVWAMVEARSQNPSQRSDARQALRRVLRDSELPWVHAWCHAGIGLSLQLESESERQAGIGHLLVVPSVHAEELPYLSGLCLARAAIALHESGRTNAAIGLIQELEILSPRHPAFTLPAVRAIRSMPRTIINGTES